MRGLVTGIVFSLLTLSLVAQEDWTQIIESEKKAFLSSQERTSKQIIASREGGEDNLDIVYQRLTLNIDPAFYYISGSVVSHFIPSQTLGFIEFDLSDSLQVDSVIYHGLSLSVNRDVVDVIRIDFPVPVIAGIIDSIDVFYQGRPSGTGFGSFVQAEHDSVPIIWTLSEPYGAKDWWPCKQNLSDKIDSLDVVVTTPDTMRAASNGLLALETRSGSTKTYHWKHRYPIAVYLVCVAVTNYVAYEDYVLNGNDSILVLNYVYPEKLEEAKEQTKEIIPIMQLFNDLFGVYPFSKEKYGHAQFGWGGGMEHQTMTFMVGFGFELMAHELAHHWFGDKVTCGSWSDIWLNEGFATYLSGLCYERLAPDWWIAFKKLRIQASSDAPHGSVWCDDTTNVSRIFDGRLTYAKGGMVLHSLRWLLGDEVFFRGVRNYIDDISLSYSFATTNDLKEHLEAASGIDLDEFFGDWVYGRGFPMYNIEWSQDFSNHLNLVIHQTQSDSSVSFFEIPVDVSFHGKNRDTTIIFNPSATGDSYSFTLPFAVDSIAFDPGLWFVSANNQVIRRGAYDFSMMIFPNPVTNVLIVRVESSEFRDADVKIINAAGQIVYTGSHEVLKGSELLQIETGKLNAGVYTLKMKSKDKTLSSSFVKLR